MERELLAVLKWHVAICIYNAIENGVGKLCKNFLLVFHEHGPMAIFAKESFVISIFLSIFQNRIIQLIYPHLVNILNVLFQKQRCENHISINLKLYCQNLHSLIVVSSTNCGIHNHDLCQHSICINILFNAGVVYFLCTFNLTFHNVPAFTIKRQEHS